MADPTYLTVSFQIRSRKLAVNCKFGRSTPTLRTEAAHGQRPRSPSGYTRYYAAALKL